MCLFNLDSLSLEDFIHSGQISPLQKKNTSRLLLGSLSPRLYDSHFPWEAIYYGILENTGIITITAPIQHYNQSERPFEYKIMTTSKAIS
jgi:hypothetical protein